MPSDPSLALQQAKSLVTALESFDGSPAQHAQILLRLNRLRAAIEYPYDISARFIENTSTMAALNILIRLGALQALPGVSPDSGDDDDKFISAAELARRANCDVSVILRPLRLLAVQGLVNQGPDPLTFRANALTQAFQPSNLGSNPPMGMSFARTWSMLPSYVATHSPEDIDNLLKTPWAYAHGVEGKSFYEGLDGDAVLRKAFDVTMRVMAENTQFRGIFPFKKVKEDVIGKEGVKERAFIVDVGGGKGQALRVIAEECGGFGGMRGVLQDLESVVKVVERDRLPEEVETMVYDAFTEQPVKHAHIYFLRHLLHDFPSPACITILRNQALAMAPDSRLIVCGLVMPDRVEVHGPTDLYWMDMGMMILGGRERTLGEFRELFREAGLELVKVWGGEGGGEVMLEARLKAPGGSD